MSFSCLHREIAPEIESAVQTRDRISLLSICAEGIVSCVGQTFFLR